MTVYVINEENHQQIGVATSIKRAIKWLLDTDWLQEDLEFNHPETGMYVTVEDYAKEIGKDWKEFLLNDAYELGVFDDTYWFNELELIEESQYSLTLARANVLPGRTSDHICQVFFQKYIIYYFSAQPRPRSPPFVKFYHDVAATKAASVPAAPASSSCQIL